MYLDQNNDFQIRLSIEAHTNSWMWSILPDTNVSTSDVHWQVKSCRRACSTCHPKMSVWLVLTGIVVVKVTCFNLSGVECSKGRSFNINQLLVSPKPRRASLNLHHFISSLDHLFLCMKALVIPPWKQNIFSINYGIVEKFGLEVTFKAHLVRPMAGQCLDK